MSIRKPNRTGRIIDAFIDDTNMKLCPDCGREYDLSMSFCLDDGAELLYGPATSGEVATAIFSLGTDSSIGNLPAERTRFVGRVRELDACAALLSSTRLLTLTGFGGCGKTRLAIKTAAVLAKDNPAGAWFVDLASITDESMVTSVAARIFAVREQAGKELIDSLAERIATTSMIIVLDNCEHLLAACVRLVDYLLTRCPNLRFIVTSREALNLQGENVFALQPLTIPDKTVNGRSKSSSEAVDLFVDRARIAQTGFELTDENLEIVAEIARRLDGIPLAIELAAARLKVLSLLQIHEMLKERFKLLARAGNADIPRHQTLQAAMEWSYDPLSDNEKVLLLAVSVCGGGCDLDLVTKVFGRADGFETLDLLSRLVDKSLVIVEKGIGSHDRYTVLETVRQFAIGVFTENGEAEIFRNAHMHAMLALAERAYVARATEGEHWANVLEVESSNLQQSLEFARDYDPELYLTLAGSLSWFWLARSHLFAGREHLSAALLATSPEPARQHRARALSGAAHILAWGGDLDAAQRWTDEALASCGELDDTPQVGFVLEEIGWSQFSSARDEEACSSFEECLRIQKAAGDPVLINRANVGLAQALVALGRIDEARPMAMAIIEFSEALADKRNEHFGWHYLADCALIRGNCDESLKLYKRSLELANALGDKIETAFEVQGVAMSLAGLGEPKLAITLDAAVRAELERIGADPHFRFWDALLERYLGIARRSLGADGFEGALGAGTALSFDEAVAFALDAMGEVDNSRGARQST